MDVTRLLILFYGAAKHLNLVIEAEHIINFLYILLYLVRLSIGVVIFAAF